MELASVKAFTNCNLKFFATDPDNWSDIAQGYILGLYANQSEYDKETCSECKNIGTDTGLLNVGLNYLEDHRDEWIDEEKITELNVLQISSALLDIYLIFMMVL